MSLILPRFSSSKPAKLQEGSDELILKPTEGLSVARLEDFLDEIKNQPQWRRQADKEADYYDGNQLDASQIEEYEGRGYAPLITNLVKPTIDVVLGMEAKSRADWKVRPEDGELNEELAEVLNEKLHKAEVASRADRAFSDAYADAVKVGLGWIEVSRASDPLENPHRAGRVRTEHAPVPGLAVRDHLADAGVLDGFGDEFAAQRLFIRVQPAQAFEVAGGADVHGIGQGRQARHWLIRGAGKIIRQHAVGIGRQRNVADGQAAASREDCRQCKRNPQGGS